MKLVANADVVVENFRTGVMKKLGIDYDTLRAKHPKLIFCSLTGYGQLPPIGLVLAGIVGATWTGVLAPVVAVGVAIGLAVSIEAAFRRPAFVRRRWAGAARHRIAQ